MTGLSPDGIADILTESARRKWKPVPDEFVVRDDDFVRAFTEPWVLANLIGLLFRTQLADNPLSDPAARTPLNAENWYGEVLPKLIVRLRFEFLRDERSSDTSDGSPILTNVHGDIFSWDASSHGVLLMNGGPL